MNGVVAALSTTLLVSLRRMSKKEGPAPAPLSAALRAYSPGLSLHSQGFVKRQLFYRAHK